MKWPTRFSRTMSLEAAKKARTRVMKWCSPSLRVTLYFYHIEIELINLLYH